MQQNLSAVRMLDNEELALDPESEDISEEELSRNFLPIGDVAKSIGVNASVLRFWEQEFPQLRPHKKGNRRYYTQSDVELIRTIQHLLYEEHYTIIGARNRIHEMLVQKKVTEKFGDQLAKPISLPKAGLEVDWKHVVFELKELRKPLAALLKRDDPFLTDEERSAAAVPVEPVAASMPPAPEAEFVFDAPDDIAAGPVQETLFSAPGEPSESASEQDKKPEESAKEEGLAVPPLPGEKKKFTVGMKVDESQKPSSIIFSSPVFWKR